MRQSHPAGERLFVDYAGRTAEVIDGATGEIRRAQIFVAVLGASNFTYAEARWTHSCCRIGSAATSARSPDQAISRVIIAFIVT
jgi:transposase